MSNADGLDIEFAGDGSFVLRNTRPEEEQREGVAEQLEIIARNIRNGEFKTISYLLRKDAARSMSLHFVFEEK